ncbi:MAG TPA: exodeoxyribonuclease VII small subunit [Polyangiaceae bacterium]|nr:exodeoxyribonuclease VII small subunit [Polyangiaceae bacterium]
MAAKKAAGAKDGPSPEGTTDGDRSFEDSIRRLSEIVETLEGGELPLEESLRLFEEGVKLARSSQSTLDRAERRVEELLSVDEEGNAVTRPLDVE